VITAGALGSHHVVATSLFGRKVGLAVAAWLTPQPATPEMRANLLSHALLETEVHLLRGPADLPGALARAFAAKTFFAERPALILPGGSSPVGVLGFVDAGLEFARQVAEGTCPKPAAVVLPCGTGGTAAGLALGMALAGLDSPVVAVRVVPAAWTPAALPGVLARATAALLARHGLFAALPAAARIRLRVDDRYLGDGYGRATAAGAEARDVLRRLEGIRLEPTYTAKAAAAFLDLARSPEMRDRSLVLWLTASAAPAPGASAPESAYLALPPEFHRWFRGES
jgi:1-aminocyclopropane-1-carboxylate deaminase/D-cysteine desulfhydrase-like pyridoxal-dependent ACC family enzyme